MKRFKDNQTDLISEFSILSPEKKTNKIWIKKWQTSAPYFERKDFLVKCKLFSSNMKTNSQIINWNATYKLKWQGFPVLPIVFLKTPSTGNTNLVPKIVHLIAIELNILQDHNRLPLSCIACWTWSKSGSVFLRNSWATLKESGITFQPKYMPQRLFKVHSRIYS